MLAKCWPLGVATHLFFRRALTSIANVAMAMATTSMIAMCVNLATDASVRMGAGVDAEATHARRLASQRDAKRIQMEAKGMWKG